MTETGWMGERPGGGPGLPVTEMLLANKERGPGDTLAEALARSRAAEARQARDEASTVRDADEVMAGMVARGYRPGTATELSMKLGDTMAELEGEREKIEKSRQRQERIRRDHDAGKLTAFDIARMDFDEGDAHRAAQLERRAESLRTQIAEAQEAIAPPRERDLSPIEAATRSAHDEFVRATREMLAGTRPAPQRSHPAPRPFAGRSASRALGDGEFDVPECLQCVSAGATAEESALMHLDTDLALPPPGTQAVRVAGQDREITRTY
jgi:hypothetical protein